MEDGVYTRTRKRRATSEELSIQIMIDEWTLPIIKRRPTVRGLCRFPVQRSSHFRMLMMSCRHNSTRRDTNVSDDKPRASDDNIIRSPSPTGVLPQVSSLPEDQPKTQTKPVTDVYSGIVQMPSLYSRFASYCRYLFTKRKDTNVSNDKPPAPDVRTIEDSSIISSPSPTGVLPQVSSLPEDQPKTQSETQMKHVTDVHGIVQKPSFFAMFKSFCMSLFTRRDTNVIDDKPLASDVRTIDDSIIMSPSPAGPPPPPTQPTRPVRFNKTIQEAIEDMDSMTREPPQAPSVDSPVRQTTKEMVWVRYLDDSHLFPKAKSETFDNVLMQMGTLLGVPADRVMLFLNGNRLLPSDTPLSARLHMTDIIECRILVKREESREEEVSSVDDIPVQMQCQNRRKKCSMVIRRFIPFKVMMEKYAQKQGRPVDQFHFLFDGDKLMPTMTPDDVDMETDDIIDVVENSGGI